MEIGTFVTWFINQVASIFSYTYTTLNNITFAGTSLLKVIIFINIIIPFLYMIITIPKNGDKVINKSERRYKK